LEGFERIGSPKKWLFTHGRRKWETFYSPDARKVQRCFLDHYLKGEANGWENTPRVRLEVRISRDKAAIRAEDRWPLRSIRYQPLYLDAVARRLDPQRPREPATVNYRATHTRGDDRAIFSYRFDKDTELTGAMSLKLWVSTSAGDDLDLFVLLRKYDRSGREVFFYGYNGFDKDGVAKGWLRASHRETDLTRSRPGRPWHTHRARQPLTPGQIVPVEIEVLSSSTLFESGSTLDLEILGHDAAQYPGFRHRRTVNQGLHTLHTGGQFDSHLLAPFVIAHRPTD
jgi:hypothetical protein